MDSASTDAVVNQIKGVENPLDAVLLFLISRIKIIGVKIEEVYNRIRGPGKELPKVKIAEETTREEVNEMVREHDSLLSALAKVVEKTKIKETSLGIKYLNLYSEYRQFRAVFDRATQLSSGPSEQPTSSGAENVEQPPEPNPTAEEKSEPQEEQCQVPTEDAPVEEQQQAATEPESNQQSSSKRRSSRLRNKQK